MRLLEGLAFLNLDECGDVFRVVSSQDEYYDSEQVYWVTYDAEDWLRRRGDKPNYDQSWMVLSYRTKAADDVDDAGRQFAERTIAMPSLKYKQG